MNRFNHLRHECCPLHASLYHPALYYEQVKVAEVGKGEIYVLIGRVDGQWVAGYEYYLKSRVGIMLSSLLGGCYSCRSDAMLCMLGEILDVLNPYGPMRIQLLNKVKELVKQKRKHGNQASADSA